MTGTGNKVIVGVAGPSCSGKTTSVDLLRKVLPLSYIPLDYFFRKEAAGRAFGYDNWEISGSLDFICLAGALRALRDGRIAHIPSAPWTEDRQLAVEPAPLIVVDGFILFIDDGVNDLLDLRFFIDLGVADQVKRRVLRNGIGQKDYIEKVVVPCFERYRPLLLSRADFVIDGGESPEVIAAILAGAIRDLMAARR